MITVLCGGVGAARFLRGLSEVVDPADIVAVVNVADDTVMHGLHISPDLDTVVYTLAGAIDPERGWGLRSETWQALDALARYEAARPADSRAGSTWFGLGDRDLATHMYRTARLAEGATLSDVTAEIVAAWGLRHRIIPATDDAVRTKVTIEGRDRPIEFQEYFVRHHHEVAVRELHIDGASAARPTDAVVSALRDADAVVIAPSNPLVSIGPIRAIPGIDDVLRARRDTVVAISPIVGGHALKGPADRLMRELDHSADTPGVANIYRDVAATLVIDTLDEADADAVTAAGCRAVVTNTIMDEVERAAQLARVTLEAATR